MTIPLILTAVLYLAAVVLLVTLGDDLLAYFWSQPEGTLLLVLWWAGAVLIMGVGLLVLILLFGTIAEAVGGPFYDQMAMRVLKEHDIATREPGFFEGTIPDIFRSLMFPIGVLVFGVLGFIPVLGVVFVAIGTGLAWLGFASGAVNPALIVTEHKLRHRLAWLREHLSTSLGMGAVVATAMLMPFLGLVAIPASIVGAAELHARGRLARVDASRDGPLDAGPRERR